MSQKICKSVLLAAVLLLGVGTALGGSLTIEDITHWKYSARSVSGVRPMADGEHYTSLVDQRRIEAYSFKTGEKTGVLFDVADTKGDTRLPLVDGYILSPDGTNILIQTQTVRIYRHSFTAVYYIYNVRNKTLTPLSDGGPQEVPAFSPDGTMVAFVRDNNLFLVRLLYNNAETQVTKDGAFNKIINGKPDWVNEEEFSFARAFDFSADNSMLAWIRYDESDVREFSFYTYNYSRNATMDEMLHTGSYTYKYPFAGEQNSRVSVMTYDLKSRATRTMKLPLDADGYVPRIHFTSDPSKLCILTQNRHQDRLDIYMADPRSTECKLAVRDHVEPYITEEPYKNISFHDGGFVLMSERSGFNHLYLYDLNGTLKRQLTKGDFVVTDYYGYDAKSGECYYGSNAEGPQYKAVYKSDAKGRVTRLSTQKGTNTAIFSANHKYFMNVYSNISTPPVTTLNDAKGRVLKTMEDNAGLNGKLAALGLSKPEFFTFTTGEGVQLNGYMIKPADFSASKRYPVVMFQYSGPGSQQVLDTWWAGNCGGCLFEHYLTQQGFICVCVDGRGTGGRGAAWEKQTYLKLGQLEARDQVETALWLGQQPYVDKQRIGIWGWSYGGYMTLMSMMEGRPVFCAGVAVAPVTSYRFYDSIYTERYMRTPKENGDGYVDCPISRAKNLEGRLLICHGTADDNVHFRNTADLAGVLISNDKRFQQIVYPEQNHSIYFFNARQHLYGSIADWFKEGM